MKHNIVRAHAHTHIRLYSATAAYHNLRKLHVEAIEKAISLHEWDEPIKRSQQAAKGLGMELLTPKLGQVVDLTLKNQFSRWWEQVQ